MIAGVGLAAGLPGMVGAAVGVGEVCGDGLPHAAMSTAVIAGTPAAIRRRARAGIRPLTR